MDDRAVPDGHAHSYGEWKTRVGVQYRSLLDIRPLPDIDQLVVTAQNGTEPDTAITAEPHAANDVGVRRDPNLIDVRELRHHVA
jgi:hypothetical protein